MKSLYIYILVIVCVVISARANDEKIPIWISTDLGPDDWGAITYLLSNPKVDIKFITVTGDGEDTCERGVIQLNSLLIHLGRESIPFMCAIKRPLWLDHTFKKPWREAARNFFGVKIPLNSPSAKDVDLLAFVTSHLSQLDNKILLIDLAPLTNTAIVHSFLYSLIHNKVSQLYFTGGNAVNGRDISWNTKIDPLAFNVVLSKEQNLFMNPHVLHINKTMEPIYNLLKVQDKKGNLNKYGEFMFYFLGLNQENMYMSDQLTAVLSLNEDIIIKTFTGKFRGDSKGYNILDPKYGNAATVILQCDMDKFYDRYVSGMLKNMD